MLLFDLSSSTSDITKASSLNKIQEALNFWKDVPWQLEASVLSHRGKNKIHLHLEKAKKMAKQIFAAFETMDIETIVSICGSPVAFDRKQFNSTSELRSGLQKIKSEQSSSSSKRRRILDVYSSMTILEALSYKGWQMDGWYKNLFSNLNLGYEDIVVLFRAGQTEDNVREGFIFFVSPEIMSNWPLSAGKPYICDRRYAPGMHLFVAESQYYTRN